VLENPRDEREDGMSELAEDLKTVGFALIDEPALGDVQSRLREALRELQRYARLPRVAEVGPAGPSLTYADGLRAVDNPLPYRGPIDGQESGATLALLKAWKDRGLRCPVVIEAWPRRGNGITAPVRPHGKVRRENFWMPATCPDKRVGVFVTDFSSVEVGVRPDRQLLGAYTTFGARGGAVTWPRDVLRAVDSNPTEVTPQTLAGEAIDPNVASAKASLFRVLRAIAEQECYAYFDSLNAYDTALISLGVAHWTFVAGGGAAPVSEGELAALASLLEVVDADAFARTFAAWGLDPGRQCASVAQCARAEPCAGLEQCTQWYRWSDEDGRFLLTNQGKHVGWWRHGTAAGGIPVDPRQSNVWETPGLASFRSWHWFHRFQSLSRRESGLRRAQWQLGERRVRAVLDAPLPQDIASGDLANARTGDVFRSELAVALLVRCHVYAPGLVVSANKAGSLVRKVLSATGSRKWGKPSSWSDSEESELIRQLLTEAPALLRREEQGKHLRETLNAIAAFPAAPTFAARGYRLPAVAAAAGVPRWQGLSRKRNSFVRGGET
jgi:hypothetical protein